MSTSAPTETLAYKVRLYPTAVKSAMLAMLCAHYAREHVRMLENVFAVAWWKAGDLSLRGYSMKGQGEFAGIARRRAHDDLKGAIRSCRATGREFRLPYLRAEILPAGAGETQAARRANHFQLWIHIEGLSPQCQMYLPANRHAALNRSLALPGSTLRKASEIFRKNGKWYARVFVRVPHREAGAASGWIGCDVGIRKGVARSDGYLSRDLRPILRRMRDRQADRQRRGVEKQPQGYSFQRSELAREARRVVSVAHETRRGIALENPARLGRLRRHAARFFGNRVVLLAGLTGVPVALVPPAFTSQTCAKCGTRESTVRHDETFWCGGCRRLTDADLNAARWISRMVRDASGRGARNPLPRAGGMLMKADSGSRTRRRSSGVLEQVREKERQHG